ncbi:MAG: chloride channel protein [Halobacteriovoraceae bacterium]|nr:chloride channel protein [Halobacteriovoraceae bacterium]
MITDRIKISKFIKFSLIQKFLKNEITEERTYFALTLLTGVLSGIVAVVVSKSIKFLTNYFGTNQAFDLNAFVYGLIAISISGWIITRKFPEIKGSGVPRVQVVLAVYHGKLPIKETLAKFLTSIFSLSSGISLGKEGPIVAICAGVGSWLGSYFHLTKKRVKSLLAIGSAGGIAAAFSTPITAVVFTMEEIVGDLNAKVLGSIVISSVVAAVTAEALRGQHILFEDLHYTLKDPRELLFYLIVGLSCAFIGPLWVKSVMTLRNFNNKLFKTHQLTIMIVSFCLMALISQKYAEVLGAGTETINNILQSLILDWKTLAILFLMKFLASTISYSSGITGGLFMPTLLMGAMLGGFIGTLANLLFPEITSNTGAYALVGMGAYFAAVMRAPFTSIILVFELTRDYQIILPLMIANIVSYAIASKIHKGSVYENLSEQDGIHLPSREDNEVLETLLIEEAMIKDIVTINASLTVREAFKEVKVSGISGFPVLKNGILHGIISINELGQIYAKGNGSQLVGDVCIRNLQKIYPDQSLLVAFHKLKKFQISRLPVVSRVNNKRLVGIITAENIVSHFGFHVKEDEKNELIERYEQEFLSNQQKEHTIQETQDK